MVDGARPGGDHDLRLGRERRRRSEGFGVPDSLVRDALGKAQGPVDTGPCVR